MMYRVSSTARFSMFPFNTQHSPLLLVYPMREMGGVFYAPIQLLRLKALGRLEHYWRGQKISEASYRVLADLLEVCMQFFSKITC